MEPIATNQSAEVGLRELGPLPVDSLEPEDWQHVSYAAVGESVDTLVISGLGESNIEGIADGLKSEGLSDVAVCNIPYPRGKLSDEAIQLCLLGYVDSVTADIQGRMAQQEDSAQLIGVGNSKGAGELLYAASQRPELWRSVTLNAPLGINNEFLGKKRMRELFNRIKNHCLRDGDNPLDFSDLPPKSAIEYALSQDGAAMAQELHGNGLLDQIYVGAEDEVFPKTELDEAVGLDGAVETVDGVGHVFMSTQEGLSHMANVIRWAREAVNGNFSRA